MKRAFLQALFLFCLLGVTWVVLYLRFRPDAVPGPEVGPALGRSQTTSVEGDDPIGVSDERPGRDGAGEVFRPEGAEFVSEWMNEGLGREVLEIEGELRSDLSPGVTAARLTGLREAFAAVPVEAATEVILAYLASGQDAPTGLAFAVGPDGRLHSAPSLRVFLIDELGFLDPEEAARLARKDLYRMKSADEHALHLRNSVWSTRYPVDRDLMFVRERALAMIHHEPWREAPSGGFAEAYDVLVYTGATEATLRLAEDTDRTQPVNLRQPSYLALDRLVWIEPVVTLPLLLNSEATMQGQPFTRAGYFARAHLGHSVQHQIVENYLLHEGIDEGEHRYFFELFPNNNFHRSQNLLTENTFPEHAELVERVEAALRAVEEWLEDERFAHWKQDLSEARERLEETLGIGYRP